LHDVCKISLKNIKETNMKSNRSNSRLELLNDELEKAAEAGDIELTLRLISQGGDIQIAMQEAGYGGHLPLINKLIERHANTDSAAFGAAQAGHGDIVRFLLKKKAKMDSAITGAVLGGHHDLIFELIGMGANLHLAVYYAMQCRRFDLVNKMMEFGASLDYAKNGALKTNFFEDKKVLLLFLAFIDDVELRKLLVMVAEEKNSALSPDIKDIFETASFLNQFMHKHGFEYQDISGKSSDRIASQEALIQRAQEAQQKSVEPLPVSGVVLLRHGMFARVPMEQPTLIAPSKDSKSCRLL